MTCADNTSVVQHEKSEYRVKCTLYPQSQEATKTDGTTLTESRGKNDLRTAHGFIQKSTSKTNEKRTNKRNEKRKEKKEKKRTTTKKMKNAKKGYNEET